MHKAEYREKQQRVSEEIRIILKRYLLISHFRLWRKFVKYSEMFLFI